MRLFRLVVSFHRLCPRQGLRVYCYMQMAGKLSRKLESTAWNIHSLVFDLLYVIKLPIMSLILKFSTNSRIRLSMMLSILVILDGSATTF